MSDLLIVAQKAVDAAMSAGADFADAWCSEYREVGVGVENTSLRECEVQRSYSISVRAYSRGGMGLSYAETHNMADVIDCGRLAADLARIADPDLDFVALPEPAAIPAPVDGLFDDKVAGLSVRDVVAWCTSAIEEAREIAPEVRLEGGADLTVGASAIASSTGIGLSREGTSAEISFQSIVFEGNDIGVYFEYDTARRLADFVPAGVAAKATSEARKYFGGRSIGTRRLPIVLGPMAASGLLFSTIQAANAESVQRDRSFLSGKEGRKIASELLTIRECPFVPGGISSQIYDGEGTPKTERDLISSGILTSYLHNSYTANKAKVANTGHGSRGGSGKIGISFANPQVACGTRTLAELIADIDEGLYVDYGGLQPEMASGDISATVDFGFKIENGKLAYPVSTTMIGSDAFELLGKIDAVSSDYREEPGMIVPSLRILDIQVASRQ